MSRLTEVSQECDYAFDLFITEVTVMSQPAFDNSMVLPSHVGRRASRKIWLPNVVYECVPYFYILSGFSALFATLYINAWYWVVPHWILFTALCLHAGTRIIYQRYRYRTARRQAVDAAERG